MTAIYDGEHARRGELPPMTVTPANDIPAILARAKVWAAASLSLALTNAREIAGTDVPNMAAEILSLRADKKRLDVLEEMLDHNDLIVHEDGTIYVVSEDGGDSEIFDTFTEAADAELLTRREKENG